MIFDAMRVNRDEENRRPCGGGRLGRGIRGGLYGKGELRFVLARGWDLLRERWERERFWRKSGENRCWVSRREVRLYIVGLVEGFAKEDQRVEGNYTEITQIERNDS